MCSGACHTISIRNNINEPVDVVAGEYKRYGSNDCGCETAVETNCTGTTADSLYALVDMTCDVSVVLKSLATPSYLLRPLANLYLCNAFEDA